MDAKKEKPDRIPTELEIETYEQQMQAFSWSFQQDVVSFLRSLHNKGIDINWAIRCILVKQKTIIYDRRDRVKARTEWERNAPKCPQCGQTMYIMRVNDRPATMVGGKYQSQWLCPNQPAQGRVAKSCGYTEFSKRSVEEWFKKLRIDISTVKKMRHPYLRNPAVDFVATLSDPDAMNELNPELNSGENKEE